MSWIGVDLDGTLAYYDEWRGAGYIGRPIPLMVERVQRWIADGHDVRICTARVSTPDADELEMAILRIEQWCAEHIGTVLPITNVKDFGMAELWDDRAVQVEPNTGKMYGPSRRGLA